MNTLIQGWEYAIHKCDDIYDPFATDPSAIYVETVDLPDPSSEQLRAVCDNKVDQLTGNLEYAAQQAKERIKSFESKFLMLPQPDAKCPT